MYFNQNITITGFGQKREKINQNFTMLSEYNWVAECPYIQGIKCSHIFKLFNGAKII